MKRDVTAKNGAEVKSPDPPKSYEREFGNAIEYMVAQMAERFRNQVFKELNQSTIKKFEDADLSDTWRSDFIVAVPHYDKRTWTEHGFCDSAGFECDVEEMSRMDEAELAAVEPFEYQRTETIVTYDYARRDMNAGEYFRQIGLADAQVGNFSRVFLRMADRTRRKLERQFDDDRLERLAKHYTGKVDRRSRDQFYRNVEKKVGISRKELESTEGLTFTLNAYKLETYQWLRKMRDETMSNWVSNTLRSMAEGDDLESILGQFDDMVEKRKNHAEMVARTQITTYNSLATNARAKNLGITKGRWITANDERVRGRPGGRYPKAKPSHWDLHGEEFDLDKGARTSTGEYIMPGQVYNCRCITEYLIPGEEEG